MPWWAWLIGGGVLVAIELVAVDAAFYFIFLGAAAVLVGLLQVAGGDLPAWGQWLLYAVFAVASMVLFRQKLYHRLRGGGGFDGGAEGELVTVTEEVGVGGETRVAMRGTQWSARNVGEGAIAAGAEARIVHQAGAVLKIVAAGSPAADAER